jgi:tripartite-type tricarboxylate transporter receptor subunit TctC
MTFVYRLGTVLALAALLIGPQRALADFPERPIHLLVPYPAGGPNDVIARIIGQKLSESLGQQLVIENRPGGSGNIAVESAARAQPDGYTIVLPAIAYAVNPALFSKIGYTFDQFAPISIVTKGPLVLVVHPSLGVSSVKELITRAKQNPGKLDYGSGSNGSSLHLAAEMFKQQAGVDMQHIPYKGTNDMIADLLTGRVPISFISPLIAKQLVAEGKLKALGLTSSARAPSWPDTPTVAEAGVRGYAVEAWYAVLAPKTTPAAIVDKLSRAIAQAVNAPDVKAQFTKLGNESVGSSPAEADAYIAQEAERWGKLLRGAGITAD